MASKAVPGEAGGCMPRFCYNIASDESSRPHDMVASGLTTKRRTMDLKGQRLAIVTVALSATLVLVGALAMLAAFLGRS